MPRSRAPSTACPPSIPNSPLAYGRAVEELNYFPNTQARALVSGKSKLLGLIVSEITNPFFPELIQEFEQVAVARGYEILIGSTNYEKKTMEQCARRMLERKVDGVAVMTFGVDEMIFDRFIADNIPIVFIDAAPSRPLSNALAVDYRTGIAEGVQHLAVLGHRKIGFISGPLKLRSSQARKLAFLECLQATGIKANEACLSKATTPSAAAATPWKPSWRRRAGPPPSCAPTT